MTAAAFVAGVLVGLEAGIWIGVLVSRPRFKRWLLWNVRCRRGRRCANLQVSEVGGGPPPGSVALLDYHCARCGTGYRSTVLVGEDGSFTQAERARL